VALHGIDARFVPEKRGDPRGLAPARTGPLKGVIIQGGKFMAASKSWIGECFDTGKSKGKTHLIIVCDTFNYDNYQVYVGPDQDVRKVVEEYRKEEMQKVVEVYNLSMDKEAQLNQERAFNY
jgi:hypothetical protein